jgi:hypothetical protein
VTPLVSIRATDDVARAAAEEASLSGASALRAVAAGYMAAAGEHPGVLLGSMTLLLCGFGATRAFDGRVRQPGLGARRPRGWMSLEEAPDVARVAAPGSIAALFIALTYDEDRRNAVVFRAGIARARQAGSSDRALLIQHLQERGGNAWADPVLHRPLLHVAGASQGGMLARGDFEASPGVDVASARVTNEAGTELTAPWTEPDLKGTSGCTLEAIAAVDRRGTAAIIVYECCTAGIEVPEWGLLAPRAAEPVIRGLSRVRPGSARPMPCPARILLTPANTLSRVELSGAIPLRVLPLE